MGRRVNICRCGTPESWEEYRKNHPELSPVIPAKVYVGENSIYLVTSQEWVDWLTGKTMDRPQRKTRYPRRSNSNTNLGERGVNHI